MLITLLTIPFGEEPNKSLNGEVLTSRYNLDQALSSALVGWRSCQDCCFCLCF